MRHTGTVLGLLLLLLAAASARDAAPDAAPGEAQRILNCLIEGHVPDEPAHAQQGGYSFVYQSLRGVTLDDRACTVYRLRNEPAMPPTPFRWMLGDEIVVDRARLPRCSDDCDWLAFAKYFPGAIDTNLSVLSYGLNADTYRESPPTYMNSVSVSGSEVAEAEGVLASSVGTEIAGTFETGDGRPITLHLIVKSRFEPSPSAGTLLVYEIEDLHRGGMLGSGRVRIAWDALDAIGAAGAMSTTRSADLIEVVTEAERFILDRSFTLTVFAADDDEPIVVVEMPAYVPVR
jgi:hypothetical protein